MITERNAGPETALCIMFSNEPSFCGQPWSQEKKPTNITPVPNKPTSTAPKRPATDIDNKDKREIANCIIIRPEGIKPA